MKRNKHYIFLIIISSLFIFSGCKSTRKLISGKNIELKAKDAYLVSMQQNAFQFQTLSARMNVDLDIPGKSLSSRVDMKMQKDSAFQLSVQPFLGIEVFRMEFSRDSVKIMDRMNKRYVTESYDGLKGETPVDFNYYNLQALFTNRLFLPGKQSISSDEFTQFFFTENDGLAEIRTKDETGLRYTFTADKEEKLVATLIADSSGDHSLQWDYNDFQITNSQPFPMYMKALIVSDGQQKGSLALHFSKVEPDVPVRMDFTIPSKYTRITYAQIIKALSNLNK
jgi:hypothetical protein|nr:DUF4292 domain-containing protein [uncultured Macellibacteroides sp.]